MKWVLLVVMSLTLAVLPSEKVRITKGVNVKPPQKQEEGWRKILKDPKMRDPFRKKVK